MHVLNASGEAATIGSVSSPRVYFDYAATAPLRPEAREAWLAASDLRGNPSSLHSGGRRARRAVEEARELTAQALRVRPSEVVFTAGGTESDNLAVKGLAWSGGDRRSIIRSPIEHHAVLDPTDWLAKEQGFSLAEPRVNSLGRVDLDDMARLLSQVDAALCTVMWANNEIGTVQPIAEIAALCAEHDVAFHTDAVQALGMLELDLKLPGLTATTLSGHKIGGPVGVGALIIDRDAVVTPLLHGGGQERDIRSGTVDAASVAAFAVAVDLAVAEQGELRTRLMGMREELVERVLAAVPQARLQGDPGTGSGQRLPGNAAISFAGCEGDALLMLLDAAGIECSTGSACASGVPEPSHVLLAMGVDIAAARGTLRFSLGAHTTPADIDSLIAALPSVVERAGRAGRPRLAMRA